MATLPPRVAVPNGLRDAIEDRYFNGPESYTSAMTVYRAIQADPTVNPKPTVRQVYQVIRDLSITQTFQPFKMHRADYDSIVAKRRVWGERRHSIQFDFVVFTMQKNHNRIGGATFIYLALFQDVYSRWAVGFPTTNKDAQTLRDVFQRVYDQIPFENATLDGESGVNSRLLKQWAAQNDVRLWINEKPKRGPSNTYMVERLVRTLRERLAKFWRANGTRKWALPMDQGTNPATAAQIRNNARPDTPILSIISQYNATRHSTLGTTPNNVMFNNVTPEYELNALGYGVCTEGQQCTPKQRAGIRRRDITAIRKVGDVGRLVKRLRLLQKKTDAKKLTAGLWRIVHITPPRADANYPDGLTNFAGEIPTKPGKSRRFLVEKVGDESQRKVVLYWEFVPIDTDSTRVYDPRSKTVKPIDITGDKEAMGRFGQRFTEADIAQAAAERALAAENIDPDQAGPATPPPARSTRAATAAVATRTRGAARPAPAAPAPAPTQRSRAAGKRPRTYKVGDRVEVLFDVGGQDVWFGAEVIRVSPSGTQSPTLRVEYDEGGTQETFPKAQWPTRIRFE